MKSILVVMVIAGVTLLGDYFLKLASQKPNTFASIELLVGAALYGSSALGWVYVMKHMTLTSVGVVYSVVMILMLAALGVLIFKETLTGREILGLGFAFATLGLMSRFS